MRRLLNCWFYGVLFAIAACLSPRTANADLTKSSVLENNVGYVGVARIGKDFPDEIGSALTTLEATNKIDGIVVDLRFAGGSDFDSLKSTEDVLEQKKLPLAILVNAQTSGAGRAWRSICARQMRGWFLAAPRRICSRTLRFL